MRRDVAYLINHAWSHLSDVHVDQKTVVSVDFKQFVFGQVFRLEVVLDIAVLVRKDYVRVSIFVAWSFEVIYFQIL